MYLLDTDTSIYLLNQKGLVAEQKLRSLKRDEVGISTITAAELFYGAAHSAKKEDNIKRVKLFCASLSLISYDFEAAFVFGSIKEYLVNQGQMIGNMDLLIASVALNRKAILVSHNIKEFQRLPDLKYEDWLED